MVLIHRPPSTPHQRIDLHEHVATLVIVGEIPKELGNLFRLSSLTLGSCRLVGEEEYPNASNSSREMFHGHMTRSGKRDSRAGERKRVKREGVEVTPNIVAR